MKDQLGREIDYIRISVTDRCNLRCVYCMPEEGVIMATHDDVLTFDEIIRTCKILADLGFKKVKLTGGEPLVRKDLPELLKSIKEIPGIQEITLTTNGILLAENMEQLASAGVDGINISLDAVEESLYKQITRRNDLDKVWQGIEKALQYPDIALKINCVPMGMNRQELAKIASLAKDYPIHVRFIEMMPIGLGHNFEFIGEEELIQELTAALGPMTPFEGKLGNGPSHYYSIPGFQGKIGFISAITHQFCDQCNRVRLTSQGFFKTCLQYEKGRDIKALLRDGSSDEVLKEAISQAIQNKPKAHEFYQNREGNREGTLSKEQRTMSQIGG